MKRFRILGVALSIFGLVSFATAQSEIKKEVNVEIENGEHIMTIKTTDKDGNVKVEEYKGEEAKKKMHEMHRNVPKGAHIEKEIVENITDKDGNEIIIKKTCDGPKEDMMWRHHGKMSQEEREAFHAKMKEFHESLSEEEKKMMRHHRMMMHDLPQEEREKMRFKMIEMHEDMTTEEREKFHKEMRELHKEMEELHEEMEIEVDEKDGKVIININGEEQVIDISEEGGEGTEKRKMIFITDDEDNDGVKMKKEIIIITKNVRIEEDKEGKNNLKGVDFKTYPNPNNGNFNIELTLDGKKDTYFTITDLTGKEIHRGQIDADKKGVYTQPVKMEGMPKGTYILQIVQGKKAATKKVIIE